MDKAEYISISIPKELGKEMDGIIKGRYRGYKTKAELVKASIRTYIDCIHKKEVETNGVSRS